MTTNDSAQARQIAADTVRLQRHGKHLLLYFVVGCAALVLFALGWAVSDKDPRLGTVLLNFGLALGPVAFLGAIYEWFLFDEIREGARLAFSGEIERYIDPVVRQLEDHRAQLVEGSHVLSQIRELGITRAYRERRAAFSVLKEEIIHEENELFLVGSSLRGLIDPEVGDQAFQEILKSKFQAINEGRSQLRVKILLTHPAFAYLRQDLEKLQSRREDFSIAREIYQSVLTLLRLGANAKHIQFVKGTPTCFGVKISKMMLLNPYPYQDQALGSFCLLVSNEGNMDYIYRAFDRAHFIWDSPNTEGLESISVQEMEKIFHTDLQTLMPSPESVQVQENDLRIKSITDARVTEFVRDQG